MKYTKEFYTQLANKVFREVNPFGEHWRDEDCSGYTEQLASCLRRCDEELPGGLRLELLGDMIKAEHDAIMDQPILMELDNTLNVISQISIPE